jgi:hypothetical protein
MLFIIERRRNSESPWKATTHQFEAETANGALRAFGLRGAYASDRVKVCTGGQTGREYRAVPFTGQPDVTPAVEPKPAPRKKRGRKPASEMTVTSNHSDKPSDKKPAYTREMRLANLAKGRAKRAANIAARKAAQAQVIPPSTPKLTAAEREAMALLERLDALKVDVERLGVKL